MDLGPAGGVARAHAGLLGVALGGPEVVGDREHGAAEEAGLRRGTKSGSQSSSSSTGVPAGVCAEATLRSTVGGTAEAVASAEAKHAEAARAAGGAACGLGTYGRTTATAADGVGEAANVLDSTRRRAAGEMVDMVDMVAEGASLLWEALDIDMDVEATGDKRRRADDEDGDGTALLRRALGGVPSGEAEAEAEAAAEEGVGLMGEACGGGCGGATNEALVGLQVGCR